jgi:hypothetical protein
VGVVALCAALESSGSFVDETLARHQALLQMNVVASLSGLPGLCLAPPWGAAWASLAWPR